MNYDDRNTAQNDTVLVPFHDFFHYATGELQD